MQASHKVIFNTVVTYTRSFITVFITLYTTKIIVKELGIEDFGLYSLVGGVVGMLAFFSSALKTSTQRYISVNIGKGFLDEIKRVVANSIVIHLLIGVIIVILAYTIGFYLIENKLVIPQDRANATLIVFYFVIASTFVTIISVPFEAIINAHENFLFLAILGIVEVLLKLGAAIFLSYVKDLDKLVLYAFLLFILLFLISLVKWVYCFYNYKETKVSLKRDFSKLQIKEQTGFVAWNLFGAACGMGRGYGIAIISNLFFGSVVNAAYGIANQVKAQSSFFSITVLNVLNPQIMKSEGANDRERMLRLSMMSCKFGFFLLAFLGTPLMFEMKNIIIVWLSKTPQYVVNFCILIILASMVEQLTEGFKSAVQSVGNIKKYMIIVGGIILLNLPITYIFLKLGFRAEIALVVVVVLELIAGFFRVIYTKKYTGLSIRVYFNRVLLKIIIPLSVSIFVCYIITHFLDFKYRFVLTISLSSILFFISIFFTGLCRDEKEIILELINKFFKKIKWNIIKK